MNNDLKLTEDERKELIAYFDEDAFPEFIANNEEDAWYGYQIGDRMFDLNLWDDTDYGDVKCYVHLCVPTEDDNWTTTLVSCPLFEEIDT